MGYKIADNKLKLRKQFKDIAGEIYRMYVFPGYDTVQITGSLMYAVDSDNNHLIFDGTKGHMIPPTWIHLEWEVEDGGTIFI